MHIQRKCCKTIGQKVQNIEVSENNYALVQEMAVKKKKKSQTVLSE